MSVHYSVQHRLRLDTHQQSMSPSPKLERPSRSPDDIIKRFLEYRPPQPSSSSNYRIHRRTRSHSPRPSVTPPMPVHRRIKSHSTTMFTPISRPLEQGQRFVDEDGQPLQPRQPSGPKTKFTPEDDALLVNLKEKHDLTWKRISDFFPGRSSGTLQVRYCTKLKAKGMTWNDEMISRLQTAMQEYESERWRIISSKVGNGSTALACKEKAEELAAGAPATAPAPAPAPAAGPSEEANP